MGLRWGSVDLDEGLLTISEQITEVNGRSVTGSPKTRRGVRTVAIDETMVAVLRDHQQAQLAERVAWQIAPEREGLVFTREDGSALRPEYVTRHFQLLAAKAGLPPVRLHDLRHTSASLALRAGVAMKVVSERLGHSTIAVTANLYTHVYDEVARDGADRIAAVLKERPRAHVSAL